MIHASVRAFMYANYKYCGYCGCRVTKQTRQLDHINPQCRGGADTSDNLRMSCKRCNRLKGKTDVDLFITKRIAQVTVELQTLQSLINK